MANIPIWAGSSSFFPGNTPFGFYDNDYQFQQDADKVAKFCALRLGYPIENVELQDTNFYTAFEQAVTVYGNELYAYKQREDYLSIEGSDNSYEGTTSNFDTTLVTPNMGPIIKLSEQYASEAGVGGNTTWYSGSIALTSSVQDYDLDVWAASQGISGSDVEIKKVFFEPNPSSFEFYGGMGYTGTAIAMFGESAGLTAYGGNQFLMMPLSFDLQAIQQLEMYRDVLFSNYTFQLINNKLRIFPIPDSGDKNNRIHFQYILKSERFENSVESGDKLVANISQYPYRNIEYKTVNSVGRSWVFEYTLALAKEMLGYVRGKYSQIPIPGAEVTLNQGDLISAATTEKDALITRLRDYFDQTSRQSMLERRQAESTARQSELDQSPMTIFIG
tara:strand:+ start:417 stop:1583 length:1167 start_codon:yes stop_codon:yes gene_type:complete